MMVIDNKYNIGDIVYLITDIEQKPRLICGINVRPAGIMYFLTQGNVESFNYEIELSSEVNNLIKING